jgi:hypothetical protein
LRRTGAVVRRRPERCDPSKRRGSAVGSEVAVEPRQLRGGGFVEREDHVSQGLVAPVEGQVERALTGERARAIDLAAARRLP